MAYLGRSYRTYALDFWGFGESGKKRDTYAVEDFVSLVDQFMDRLGISEAPLVGHSMGGTVSLLVALQYPHRVSRVVVVGSPIVGSSLALPLKLAGYRFIAFMLFNMMWAFRAGIKVASPFICADPKFPQMMDRDLSRTTLESFLRSIASLRRTDLRPDLAKIQIPTMGIYGGGDNIVHPKQWQPLLQGVPHSKIVFWEQAKHFVMLDMSKDFTETLKLFLDGEEKVEA
jgi:pimeloyl-ACP methyl ester carboxylesterase